MRPSRPAAIAVIVGSLAAIGCMNTEPKEPLSLGNDTRAALGGGSNTAVAKTTKTASFDPSATGGKGITKENSFNRTVPGPGTGTTTGNFASSLPPPQIGQQPPAAVAPAREGASYANPSEETGRTSMATRAAPPSIPPVTQPIPPVAAAPPVGTKAEPSPFAPKLDAPINDPPVRQAVAIEPVTPVRPAIAIDPAPPAPPTPVQPVIPVPERSPLPAPVMPGSSAATIPPVAPPAPVAATNESLPVAPTIVPSPNVVPISGMESAPKIPPAPPILPSR